MQHNVTYPDTFRTPAFIVDVSKVRANAADMIARSDRWGVRLRPHVKTHKTIEIAKLQTDGAFGGITVSTMAEAQFFAEAEFNDIVYAFPITADKLGDCFELAGRIKFGVVTDNEATVKAICKAASQSESSDAQLGVYIEIDTGAGRTGTSALNPSIIDWAKELHETPGIEFRGLLTHAGQSYTVPYEESLERVVLEEARILRDLAAMIEASGTPCVERSLGSTPAARYDHDATAYEGITEMRPGNYIFFDGTMVECGHCKVDEVACFVATRIIGIYPDRKTIAIDAGALALSKDLGPTHLKLNKGGYGLIQGHDTLRVTKVSQEHGLVSSSDEEVDYSQFSVGQILHVIPNHSCLTAAMFPEYQWLESDWITSQIKPVRGW